MPPPGHAPALLERGEDRLKDGPLLEPLERRALLSKLTRVREPLSRPQLSSSHEHPYNIIKGEKPSLYFCALFELKLERLRMGKGRLCNMRFIRRYLLLGALSRVSGLASYALCFTIARLCFSTRLSGRSDLDEEMSERRD
jgi:hypothetical protein